MAYISRTIVNQDDVARAIEAKGDQLVKAQKSALEAGAEVLRRRMIDCAHTAFTSRSGKLIGNIKAQKATATGVKVGVWTKDVLYAYYVEKGHAPPYRAKRIRSSGSDARARDRAKRAKWKGRGSGGRTPPHPYIEPATDAMPEAMRVVEETMKREAGL